jgi:ATP-binding cassette, subfamily B, bacterial
LQVSFRQVAEQVVDRACWTGLAARVAEQRVGAPYRAEMHPGSFGAFMRHDESQSPDVDRVLLSRVLGYARPYRRQLVYVLVTIVVITILSLAPPLLMRTLIDDAIPAEDLVLVTWLGIAMVAVPLINGVVGVYQRRATAQMGEGIIYDLRRELFDHLQSMSLGFFTNTKTGELMSRLNSDVVGAQQAVSSTFVTLVSNVFAVVATLFIMVRLEWRLTLLAVSILPLFIIASRQVGKRLRVVRRTQMEANADMTGMMQETLSVSGALLVKLFGRSAYESGQFSTRAGKVRNLGITQAVIGRWFFMALGLVSALGTAVTFWLGAVMVINGTITIGTIVALSAYLAGLYGPLAALANARVEFTTSLVSFERVFEVLDLPVDVPAPSNPVKLEDVEGRVSFDGVWFSYDTTRDSGLESVRRFGWGDSGVADETSTRPSSGWVLEDVSFTIEPGRTVALVGPSGAGKTTITYLVPRLYDASQGVVSIDGVDVRDLAPDSIARAVGVVTQDTYLFHDTIEANLQYADPTATTDQILAAAEAANILEFIQKLPEGLATRVGERGYRLSGGEKQRIAIARVILKNPSILILDEATSHLDARSEALVQDALEGIMTDRTSLVIAHRLSTVLNADTIVVIDGGRVVEIGHHEELVTSGGLYSHLFETQFRAAAVRP